MMSHFRIPKILAIIALKTWKIIIAVPSDILLNDVCCLGDFSDYTFVYIYIIIIIIIIIININCSRQRFFGLPFVLLPCGL